MNQKVNGYSAEYLKRQARKISKTNQISHRSALDIAAKNAGFSNWKDFLYKCKSSTNDFVQDAQQILLTKKISKRQAKNDMPSMNPFRKLLVAGVNELLKQKLISLDPKDNIPVEGGSGHLLAKLFNEPSVIIYRDIGYDELEIAVWWKYDHDSHPQANLAGRSREQFHTASPLAKRAYYKNFVGVVVSTWLERRTGKFLQGKGDRSIVGKYVRRGEKSVLDRLPGPIPNGFEAEGKFIF